MTEKDVNDMEDLLVSNPNHQPTSSDEDGDGSEPEEPPDSDTDVGEKGATLQKN